MEGEYFQDFFFRELRGQPRGLPTVELPGHGMAHLVRVAVAFGDAELDPVFGEDFCVGGFVHRPGIAESGVHRVAQSLFKTAG